MTTYKNLTPHTLNVHRPEGEPVVLPVSGEVARVAEEFEVLHVNVDSGIEHGRTVYGEVEGLPAPERDTVFVVSAMVRTAVPHRLDVASPGPLIRDAAGRPIGCRGLTFNT